MRPLRLSAVFQPPMIHWTAGMLVMSRVAASLVIATLALPLAAQTPPQPLTVTLEDAINRARQYGTQIQSANINVALAREDRAQAKAATLPSLNAFNQFI